MWIKGVASLLWIRKVYSHMWFNILQLPLTLHSTGNIGIFIDQSRDLDVSLIYEDSKYPFTKTYYVIDYQKLFRLSIHKPTTWSKYQWKLFKAYCWAGQFMDSFLFTIDILSHQHLNKCTSSAQWSQTGSKCPFEESALKFSVKTKKVL